MTEKPATTNTLSSYLKGTCEKMGYTKPVTFNDTITEWVRCRDFSYQERPGRSKADARTKSTRPVRSMNSSVILLHHHEIRLVLRGVGLADLLTRGRVAKNTDR